VPGLRRNIEIKARDRDPDRALGLRAEDRGERAQRDTWLLGLAFELEPPSG
jgi:hypothetical protein